MTNIFLLIVVTIILCITVNHCQAWNDTDSREYLNDINSSKPNQPFIYHGRYHPRIRRQYESIPEPDTASTILSILPLDRFGTIVGQIMSTGLKEMLNPDVGKKIINVLETQSPLLLTSLFTNLMTNLRAPPARSPSTTANITSSASMNDAITKLSNTSTSDLINAIRRPTKK